ncbi:MAG: gliding motility-associated protein GldE [Cytophagaceae bacterium]|nr:gliding motility-associated protein GldE [Cytophagaceae bacterium]
MEPPLIAPGLEMPGDPSADPLPALWHLATVLVQVVDLPLSVYLINGLILMVLLGLSAIVSGSEVAFFSLSADERARCRDSDSAIERKIVRLLDRPQLLLATLLIFTNLLNITFITITAYLTSQLLGNGVEKWVGILVQTVGVTFVIVFFGELIPKVWANQNNLRFLRYTAPIIATASRVFRPISVPLMGISNVIEKRVQRKGYTITAEELTHALEITTGQGTSAEQKEILRGIVNFSSIAARQIMQSRMDITAFDVELDFHELMDKINKSGYSRVPVYRESLDKIEGILYIKDLLVHLDNDENYQWQTLIRPPFFIPESKKIDDLLHDFQEKRVHMSIVVNEYGETEGLVTLEDIIEEIVGDIQDEFDEEEVDYTRLDANTYVFEGKTPLANFCKILDIDLEVFEKVRGESESLGGLLLELFARLPKANEEIRHANFQFRIISADTRRIKRVRVVVEPEDLKNNAEL